MLTGMCGFSTDDVWNSRYPHSSFSHWKEEDWASWFDGIVYYPTHYAVSVHHCVYFTDNA